MELRPGLKGAADAVVVPADTAAAMGSGALPVYATPSMIALMEKAAMDSVQPFLEEGQGTVGIYLEISHLAASPVGMPVRAESELVSVEGRTLGFRVCAFAGEERIGEGTHRRCIVWNERFLEKTLAKLK